MYDENAFRKEDYFFGGSVLFYINTESSLCHVNFNSQMHQF